MLRISVFLEISVKGLALKSLTEDAILCFVALLENLVSGFTYM